MKPFNVICLVTCIAVVSCLTQCKAKETKSARESFQISKVFDFTQYKQIFHKSYGSWIEELARQKLFLGKFFRAVISRVKYRNEKSDYYLSINHLSDRTPDEIHRLLVPRDMIDDKMLTLIGNLETSESDDTLNDPPLTIDESTFEQVVGEINQHSDESGYKEIAKELQEIQRENSNRSKRSILSWRNTKLKGDFIEKPAQELANQVFRADKNDKARWYNVKGSKRVKDLLHRAANILSVNDQDVDSQDEEFATERHESLIKQPADFGEKSDDIRIDFRKTNCILPPRSQGDCGSCYAFATIALYEYLYCRAIGKAVSLSEQYIIDCGFRSKLKGCEGGSLPATVKFVEDFGVELNLNYGYRAEQKQCPYDQSVNSTNMGHLRLSVPPDAPKDNFVFLNMSSIGTTAIEEGPILINILDIPDFQEYGGGVHQGLECTRDGYHSMLIVGFGIEEGDKYYLIKNSFGTSWGEKGYFKMSVEGYIRCSTKIGLRSTYDFSYKSKYEMNPRYEPNFVGKRFADDMRNMNQRGINHGRW